ncbi:MAG: AI-2E family transporter [Candidatus Paceibacterota bacterium]
MNDTTKNVSVTISNGTLIRIVLFAGLCVAFIKLTNLILVVLTSIVVASFIESAVRRAKPYIKNRTLAVFVIYSLSIGILVGLFSVFVPVFINEMSALVAQLGSYIPNDSLFNTFQTDTISGAKGVVSTISHDASLGEVIESAKIFFNSVSGGFFDVFGSAFGGVINFGLIFIISFYLSITEKGIENFLRIIMPASHEEYVIDLWQRTERKIGLWMQGQMLMGVLIGMLAYLGLTILDVKYSLVLALFVVIAELVPFGLILATIPAVVFAYLDGGVTMSLLVATIYLILGQFETYLIYPLIVKKATGISPLVVILSLLVGGTLAGFWGIILAVPCAVCLLEFVNDLEKKKVLSRTN